MFKEKGKLYLVDQNDNSPCFGLDEEIEIEANNINEYGKKVMDAIEDYAHFLVANEDFGWSDIVGYHVCKNGVDYEIKCD